jgi:hypothetical protein
MSVLVLMADSADGFPMMTTIVDDGPGNLLTIGQSSVPKQRALSPELVHSVGFSIPSSNFRQIGSSEVTVFQENSIQLNIFQNSEGQVGALQTGPYQTRGFYIDPHQSGSGQIRTIHINQIEPSTIQISSKHAGIFEDDIFEANTPKISSTQVDASQFSIFDNSAVFPIFTQSNTSKIPFSSSVTLQEFINGQNKGVNSSIRHGAQPTFDVGNYINSSILGFWQTFDPTFDLTLGIKDLPTGQLAEANIIGFDPTGRPNAGTLYLDTDANGLGWYIDPTPWDNSEYSQTLTDTAYRGQCRLRPLRPPHHPPPRNQPPSRLHLRL